MVTVEMKLRDRGFNIPAPGLAIYVPTLQMGTSRLDHATRFIEKLKVGTVNIWEIPSYRTETSPFGSVKDSGNGTKERVVEAMKAYEYVLAAVGRVRRRPPPRVGQP